MLCFRFLGSSLVGCFLGRLVRVGMGCTELEKAGEGEEAREIMLICHIHSHCSLIGNSLILSPTAKFFHKLETNLDP